MINKHDNDADDARHIPSLGVRFDNGPTIHYVEAPEISPKLDSHCVISTRRGLELARIRTALTTVEQVMGNFVRLASDKDLEDYARLQEKADDLKWLLRAKVREQRIKAKIVKLEFTLNEALLVVNYSSDKHVNFRELLADITPHTKARIEFNAVGPRDQARMLGTLGVCGTGSCSSTWLQSFNAVGIRMARDQQLSLNPEKISGPCGRLMCCLQYEHDQYVELLAGLPRKGSRACHTESGTCGRVHKLHILKERVELKTDEGKIVDYPVAELDY